MALDAQMVREPLEIKQQKRGDLVAEAIKRLITEGNLLPGDRLPREVELQQMFGVSKSTIREALKSLEVQGLIKVSTGPSGGGMVVEVPLERTFQLMQNYLFFKEVSIDDIYTVRQLLEPELAAGAVPHLTEADFEALEHNMACCSPASHDRRELLRQRQADVDFHDILAAANPNSFLRFTCELVNEMIRQLIVFGNETPRREHEKFGTANVNIHREITEAARAGDAQRVRELMHFHMQEARTYIKRMNGKLRGRLILDSDIADMQQRVRSQLGAGAPPLPRRKSAAVKMSPEAGTVPPKRTVRKAAGEGTVLAKTAGKTSAKPKTASTKAGVAAKVTAPRKRRAASS
ncbi:GntR family transcriptional regulator [Pandoraea horticolens]|uniref:GntR family transcriptional regulator n=1 Tax=Pandoraea horticolens TaxID=2508298 RepID=A0A5E4S1X5_9BURK|nr:FadR/GntR family transcriptional regulator [Pandoraea horticolens]VVD68128.1 GntR family transcriptional regulator [Pandoraea horticolens]